MVMLDIVKLLELTEFLRAFRGISWHIAPWWLTQGGCEWIFKGSGKIPLPLKGALYTIRGH
jgi:hypothetical protein